MPPHHAPGLGLRVGFQPNEDGWGDEYNEDLRRLSAVVQMSVLSRVSTLPSNPTIGDRYMLVGDSNSALGDSNSQAGSNSAGEGFLDQSIAVYDGDSNSASEEWFFYVPNFGWRCYVEDEDAEYLFTVDEVWVLQASSGPPDATIVTYNAADPGDSNSTQTTVQGALDDLYSRVRNVGTPDASGVTYAFSADSNSDAATTVEQALDALFTRPYVVGLFVEGSTSDISKTRTHVVALSGYIPADFVGSVGYAENADDTDLVITILKNGTTIGTATFAGDSNSNFTAVTFDAASPSNSDQDFAFSPGDRLQFLMPSSFGSWNDIGLTLLLYRTV